MREKTVVDPHPWRARRFALLGQLGVATPLGCLGIWAEGAPIEHLSLSLGVGTNLLGKQLAAMVRARATPADRSSFYIGAGYSQGFHAQGEGSRDGVFSLFLGPLSSMSHSPSPRGHRWETARWVNVEIGSERVSNSGFALRGFVGGAFLINADDGATSFSYDPQAPILAVRAWMIYAGGAFGYAI